MNNESFKFKQFTVKHDRCAMKVGTDGVLLGSWAEIGQAHEALDVGCGSGLIALMLAQRAPTLHITGIDIDEDSIEQARENAANSRWNDRIFLKKHDFTEDFPTARLFDLIISNPPFYMENTPCPDGSRDKARHTSSLPTEKLIQNASKLLSATGHLAIIVPTTITSTVIGEASMHRLYLSRRTDVKTTPTKPAKRTLLEFCKAPQNTTLSNTLVLRTSDNQWSAEYKILTQDFYL